MKKAAIQLLLLILALFWLAMTLRNLAAILFLALAGCYVVHAIRPVPRLYRALWIAFLISTVLSVDVRFPSTLGPPRLIPLVMGLPGEELPQRASRGEVLLGGCLVSGFEPKWILVFGEKP